MALLATVVRRQVKDAPDTAAAELAVTYAKAIDNDADKAGQYGPLLLAVLEALLMTPRARAAGVKGGGSVGKPGNPLDELRARRAARVNNTQTVDPATP